MAGNRPHVSVLKAFRKLGRGSLERGSGEECVSHSGRNQLIDCYNITRDKVLT